jgi:starvation-inducible DNA-binding protein
MKIHTSGSILDDQAKMTVIAALNASLADTNAIFLQAKVAHWNVKGPLSPALKHLFNKLAKEARNFTCVLAHRVQALGGEVEGTLEQSAASSRIPAYPDGVTKGLVHVGQLNSNVLVLLANLRQAEEIIEQHDEVTEALLIEAIGKFERYVAKLSGIIEG